MAERAHHPTRRGQPSSCPATQGCCPAPPQNLWVGGGRQVIAPAVLDHPHRLHRRKIFQRKSRNREPHSAARSEEHTSELQSLMRISYAVFCLKKKKNEKR